MVNTENLIEQSRERETKGKASDVPLNITQTSKILFSIDDAAHFMFFLRFSSSLRSRISDLEFDFDGPLENFFSLKSDFRFFFVFLGCYFHVNWLMRIKIKSVWSDVRFIIKHFAIIKRENEKRSDSDIVGGMRFLHVIITAFRHVHQPRGGVKNLLCWNEFQCSCSSPNDCAFPRSHATQKRVATCAITPLCLASIIWSMLIKLCLYLFDLSIRHEIYARFSRFHRWSAF